MLAESQRLSPIRPSGGDQSATRSGAHRRYESKRPEGEFINNGLGQRVRMVEKTNGAVTSNVTYLWAGGTIAEERDSTGATVAKRYRTGGMMIGATKYFFTDDHLGSIREVTDSSGNVLSRFDYDLYGNRTQMSGTFDPGWGFTGHWHHSSGLILTWFRVYDPQTGRWLKRDPIGELDGINLYAYAHDSPSNYVDKLGLWVPGDHHKIIEDGLPGVSPEIVQAIKNASDNADTAPGAQDAENSYMHGMRAPDQSAEDAIRMTDLYIKAKMYTAVKSRCSGDNNSAYKALGEAMHAAMDTYSMDHRDGQGKPYVWRGMSYVNPFKLLPAIAHGISESYINEADAGMMKLAGQRVFYMYQQFLQCPCPGK
jgi:RHS repeat-associated protein